MWSLLTFHLFLLVSYIHPLIYFSIQAPSLGKCDLIIVAVLPQSPARIVRCYFSRCLLVISFTSSSWSKQTRPGGYLIFVSLQVAATGLALPVPPLIFYLMLLRFGVYEVQCTVPHTIYFLPPPHPPSVPLPPLCLQMSLMRARLLYTNTTSTTQTLHKHTKAVLAEQRQYNRCICVISSLLFALLSYLKQRTTFSWLGQGGLELHLNALC